MSSSLVTEGKLSVVMATLHPVDDVRVASRVARTVAEAGYSVRLIGLAPRSQHHPAGTLPFKVDIIPGSLRPLRKRIGTIIRVANASRRASPDVLHIHDPDLLPFASAWAALTRRPVVYDIHEFYELKWTRSLPGRIRGVARRLVLRVQGLLTRICGAAVVVNSAMEPDLRRAGVRHVGRVPNYALLSSLPPDAGHADWRDRKYDLIHIGSLSRSKGSDLLVDILASVLRLRPGAEVLVIERFHRDVERAHFLEALSDAGIRDSVTLMPNMDVVSLARLLARAKVGLSPVIDDQGQARVTEHTKLFEYLAAGTIPVASDLPGARQVLGTTPGILVGGDDPAQWAEAIVSILSDVGSPRASDVCKVRYSESYTWERAAVPELLRIYTEVAPARRLE